jgi:hypothetical protein
MVLQKAGLPHDLKIPTERKQVYVHVFCLSQPLSQLSNFHRTLYERYATEGCSNVTSF